MVKIKCINCEKIVEVEEEDLQEDGIICKECIK